ncbi:type II toxin-antitoxin system toxin ribonuclease VapC11 [Humibacter ginsengiterrae]
MILVDTSAWVEFLRGTDDPVVRALTELIEAGEEVGITEPIVMELLAGATTPELARSVETLVDGLPIVPVDALLDYRAAAALYVASRRNGHPIRSLVDCLIAAVAIRRDVWLLHRDRDFGFLAEISPLKLR